MMMQWYQCIVSMSYNIPTIKFYMLAKITHIFTVTLLCVAIT